MFHISFQGIWHLPIGVYYLVPFPSEWGKKTNWDGWGSRLLNLPPKTLLRSTFWWILGPVLRLLSGDGFMESKTLGWIWMYTDTGGTRPDPWIFKLQTHPFFLVAFFLKHWSQSVFLSIGSSQKQITRFFLFLETFAASLLWILIVSLFGGCQAFSFATPFFRPYFLFIHESNRAGSVVPFFLGRIDDSQGFLPPDVPNVTPPHPEIRALIIRAY